MSDAPVRRYRRAWLTGTWVAVFGLFPLVTGAYGAAYTAGLLWHHGPVSRAALGWWIGWAMVGLAAGVRSALVSVVATPDELIVRNFFTTHRVPWTAVGAIERPRPWRYAGKYSGFYNRNNGLHIRLNDGGRVIAGAYTPAGGTRPGSPMA